VAFIQITVSSGEFLEQLSDCQLRMKGSAFWSLLKRVAIADPGSCEALGCAYPPSKEPFGLSC
jgi:hypothetical protein